MRFERYFEYNDLMNTSFHQFIEKIKVRYPNDQVIGYRAIKSGSITKVTITFVRKEKK